MINNISWVCGLLNGLAPNIVLTMIVTRIQCIIVEPLSAQILFMFDL